MGLDINSPNKQYHAGYHGLQRVRWLALLTCGFPEKIQTKSSMSYYPMAYIWTLEHPAPNADEYTKIIDACAYAGYIYPNLLLHSDAEGDYTKKGKPCSDAMWFTGNSIAFKKELETLRRNLPRHLKKDRPWSTFKMLYTVVKDEITNGKGIIRFT